MSNRSSPMNEERVRRDYANERSFWDKTEAEAYAVGVRARLRSKGFVDAKVRVKWHLGGYDVQIGWPRVSTPKALRPYRR